MAWITRLFQLLSHSPSVQLLVQPQPRYTCSSPQPPHQPVFTAVLSGLVYICTKTRKGGHVPVMTLVIQVIYPASIDLGYKSCLHWGNGKCACPAVLLTWNSQSPRSPSPSILSQSTTILDFHISPQAPCFCLQFFH